MNEVARLLAPHLNASTHLCCALDILGVTADEGGMLLVGVVFGHGRGLWFQLESLSRGEVPGKISGITIK